VCSSPRSGKPSPHDLKLAVPATGLTAGYPAPSWDPDNVGKVHELRESSATATDQTSAVWRLVPAAHPSSPCHQSPLSLTPGESGGSGSSRCARAVRRRIGMDLDESAGAAPPGGRQSRPHLLTERSFLRQRANLNPTMLLSRSATARPSPRLLARHVITDRPSPYSTSANFPVTPLRNAFNPVAARGRRRDPRRRLIDPHKASQHCLSSWCLRVIWLRMSVGTWHGRPGILPHHTRLVSLRRLMSARATPPGGGHAPRQPLSPDRARPLACSSSRSMALGPGTLGTLVSVQHTLDAFEQDRRTRTPNLGYLRTGIVASPRVSLAGVVVSDRRGLGPSFRPNSFGGDFPWEQRG